MERAGGEAGVVALVEDSCADIADRRADTVYCSPHKLGAVANGINRAELARVVEKGACAAHLGESPDEDAECRGGRDDALEEERLAEVLWQHLDSKRNRDKCGNKDCN